MGQRLVDAGFQGFALVQCGMWEWGMAEGSGLRLCPLGVEDSLSNVRTSCFRSSRCQHAGSGFFRPRLRSVGNAICVVLALRKDGSGSLNSPNGTARSPFPTEPDRQENPLLPEKSASSAQLNTISSVVRRPGCGVGAYSAHTSCGTWMFSVRSRRF